MVQVIDKSKEKTKLKLIKQKQSYNIVIPKNVEEKIRHLCSVVHEVEWSGVLFYKKEGSFESNDLKITCVDIFPMDIGSGGFTDFDDTLILQLIGVSIQSYLKRVFMKALFILMMS